MTNASEPMVVYRMKEEAADDPRATTPSSQRQRRKERGPVSERERFEIVGWDEA